MVTGRILSVCLSVVKSCESDWTKCGNLCYKLVQSETLNYTAAQTACAADGGLLAAPTTELIHNKLTGLNDAGTAADFWVGLDDR